MAPVPMPVGYLSASPVLVVTLVTGALVAIALPETYFPSARMLRTALCLLVGLVAGVLV